MNQDLKNKILEEFEKVRKEFMSNIENGTKEGFCVLDTDLFKSFLSKSLAKVGEEEYNRGYEKAKADLSNL